MALENSVIALSCFAGQALKHINLSLADASPNSCNPNLGLLPHRKLRWCIALLTPSYFHFHQSTVSEYSLQAAITPIERTEKRKWYRTAVHASRHSIWLRHTQPSLLRGCPALTQPRTWSGAGNWGKGELCWRQFQSQFLSLLVQKLK